MPSLRSQFGQFGQSGPMDLSLDECRENDLFTRKPSDLSRYTLTYVVWLYCYAITKSCRNIQRKLKYQKILRISSPCKYDVPQVGPIVQCWLKLDSHLPKKNFFYFNESPLKVIKNTFYFILKTLFVLKILKFLCGLLGHAEKTAWFKR